MRFYWLVLGALAVWRITHLLAAEDGPWDLVLRLRKAAGLRVLGPPDGLFSLHESVGGPPVRLRHGGWLAGGLTVMAGAFRRRDPVRAGHSPERKIDMSCCGKGREQFRNQQVAAHALPFPTPCNTPPRSCLAGLTSPRFVSNTWAKRRVTLESPEYRPALSLRAKGARVEIDLRDRPWLASQPNLRQLPNG